MADTFPTEQFDAVEEEKATDGEFEAFDVLPTAPYRVTKGAKDNFLYFAGMNFDPPLSYGELDPVTTDQNTIEATIRASKITEVQNETRNNVQQAASVNDITGVQKAVMEGDVAASNVESDSTPEFNIFLDPEVLDIERRLEKSVYSVTKKIAERFAADAGEGYEDSFITWGGVGDFIDMLVSSPVQALTGLPWWQSDQVRKWKQAVAEGASQQTIEALENEVIDYIEDSGLLTESNRFMLMSLMEDFEQGGEGLESDLNKAFGILDIAGVAVAAPKFAKGIYNVTRAARAAGGLEESSRVLRHAVVDPSKGAAAGIPEETTISGLKLPVTNYDNIAAPGVAISKQGDTFVRVKELVNSYRKINPVNMESFRKALPQIVKEVTRETERMMSNINIADVRVNNPDRFGNIVADVVIGTNEGAPIRNELSAKAKAKKIGNGAKIEKVDGENAWYVKLPINIGSKIALEEVTPEVLNKTIGKASRFLNGTLSSVNDLPRHLDALAKQAEGVIEPFIGKLKKDFESLLKSVDVESLGNVDQIFRDLRDGRDSHLRQAWSPEEFKEKYYTKFDRLPSEAEVNVYSTVQAFNDVNYELKALEMMNTAANERFVWHVSISEDSGDVARYAEFGILGRNDPVVKLKDGTILTKEGVGEAQLTDKMAVLELENTITLADGTRTRFVIADPVNVRRAFASDYLNYNPGGVRDYKGTYSYVVKQDNDGDLLSVMGARSEKDAQAGARDLNTIISAVTSEVPELSNKALSSSGIRSLLEGVVGNKKLDDVIRNNNGWNPNVNSVDDLVKWMDEGNSLRFSEEIGVAGWDDPIRFTTDVGASVNRTASRTYGESVFRAWNRPRTSTRKDRPLYGYGNDDIELSSPIDTIINDSMRTLHADAFRAYDEQAARGTLARAKDLVPDRSEVDRAERVSVLKGVEVAYEQLSKLRNPGVDHRTYKVALKRILMQRDMKNGTQRLWEAATSRLAESLWDRGNKGISKWMHNISAQNRANPVDWLRSRNFAMRLGFFDPSQLIVQTAHIWNIMAISPKYGFQGAIHSIPMKVYAEARTLAQREAVISRAAKVSGESVDELRELYEWMRTSGRANVGQEVAEHGGMVQTSIKTSKDGLDKTLNLLGKVERAGLIPFNVGESLPRTSAIYTAIKEYKKLFPKADIFSDEATLWITRRQDVLTGMMTRTSSGSLNRSGTLALPLQFLSYSMRMIETILRGDLTPAEKGRLFGAQIGFWGAGGVGLAQISDTISLGRGNDITEKEYLILRNGLLGEMYNWAVAGGQRGKLDISNRLQIGEGIIEAIKGLSSESFLETFTGPGGQLVGDIFSATLKGMYNAYHGNVQTTHLAVLETIRNISSFNRAYRAYATFYYGQYLSKKGVVAEDGLTGQEALGILLGATPVEVEAAWSANQFLRGKNDFVKETRDQLRAIKVQIEHALRDNDIDRANKLWEEAAFYVMLLHEAGVQDDEFVSEAIKPGAEKVQERLEAWASKTNSEASFGNE